MATPAVGRILVGIGPSGRNSAALEYAAAEAKRRGCGVHLVLVIHPRWPGPDGMVELKLVGQDLVRVDTDLLMACEQWLVDRSDGDLRVTTKVVHGAPTKALVHAARNAGLVVLQHHRMAREHHLPTMSITNAVASRSAAPVVAVPDDWHEDGAGDLPVVAAVVDAETSRGVATHALEAARRSGSDLHVTRAWSYATDLEVEDPIFSSSSADDWEACLTERLTSGLGGLLAGEPTVASRTDVVHGQPAYVLVEASRHARLVVIGRHRPMMPVGSHLGPVTRSVLTHAHCPVLVVDASAAGPDADPEPV
ncbi:universal stress protein [Nocardioides cynanchi]|uniref:universal stress protein n=1 Tax=Nocardioides cynanchi TaxID=2558918 RepID=UPI00177B1945|nr:universal stress protein [Nocardioides cynanchi]